MFEATLMFIGILVVLFFVMLLCVGMFPRTTSSAVIFYIGHTHDPDHALFWLITGGVWSFFVFIGEIVNGIAESKK